MKTLTNAIFVVISIALIISSCGGKPSNPVDTGAQANIHNVSNKDEAAPCVYNIYVENSGSMYGYVKGVTEFEQSVYSYLSDIKISDLCSEMNLYYINSLIHKQPDDVADFISKLEPETFLARGGNMSTTDIANIIKDILKRHGKDTVSILVSDFVFSPGTGKNAEEYLLNQQIGIKNQFAMELKDNPELSVILYQLSSQFNGIYYDREDRRYKINQKRPFYILVIGDKKNIKQLSDKIPAKSIKGTGVLNSLAFSKLSGNDIEYGILTTPRIGSFRPDPSSPMISIKNAKIDKKGPEKKFMLSIGVDYSHLLFDDSYLMDPDNYGISNNSFNISVDNTKRGKYTHTIKLSLNPQLRNLYKGQLTIKLLNNYPDWCNEATSIDDTSIDMITTDKTYGFKYLVNGIYDSFYQETEYVNINIKIE